MLMDLKKKSVFTLHQSAIKHDIDFYFIYQMFFMLL